MGRSEHSIEDRPRLSEAGECCATCRYYCWGDHLHYRHGYCRAYMTFTNEGAVCDHYYTCPACDDR
jgi:hypothetical protein